jgi:phosphotriesterase-related protein
MPTTPGSEQVSAVQTYLGPIDASELGTTLIHEHLFVRDLDLELNDPHPEWEPTAAVDAAVAVLAELATLGVRTVVDLTVPGLGRDVQLVADVAARSPVHLLAATGYYTTDVLPIAYRLSGPGRLVDGPEPLEALFVRDIEEGIAGSSVRAAIIKVVTDVAGITDDVARILRAAAAAQQRTGVAVMTHSHPASGSGRAQVDFLRAHGVPPERIVIGHCGDTADLDALRSLLETGVTLGMDRFGMEHILSDADRVRTVIRLVADGNAEQLVLSSDAAVFSRMTPPSWRAVHAPGWRLVGVPSRIVPMLRDGGVSDDDIEQMMVANPRRILEPAER